MSREVEEEAGGVRVGEPGAGPARAQVERRGPHERVVVKHRLPGGGGEVGEPETERDGLLRPRLQQQVRQGLGVLLRHWNRHGDRRLSLRGDLAGAVGGGGGRRRRRLGGVGGGDGVCDTTGVCGSGGLRDRRLDAALLAGGLLLRRLVVGVCCCCCRRRVGRRRGLLAGAASDGDVAQRAALGPVAAAALAEVAWLGGVVVVVVAELGVPRRAPRARVPALGNLDRRCRLLHRRRGVPLGSAEVDARELMVRLLRRPTAGLDGHLLHARRRRRAWLWLRCARARGVERERRRRGAGGTKNCEIEGGGGGCRRGRLWLLSYGRGRRYGGWRRAHAIHPLQGGAWAPRSRQGGAEAHAA